MGRSRYMVKGLASVAQLIFSSITLYKARGSQLQRYGYAAFGLSVFPYTLMTFVNLVFLTVVGEYSTIFILRTAILDEAKQCGGAISGEIGTLPKSPARARRVIINKNKNCNLNGMEIGNDGEDRHVTPLPKVNYLKMTTTGTPPEAKDIGTGGEGKDGSRLRRKKRKEDPAVFLSGPLVAANIRVEDDGVLVITMKGRTGRFKLIEADDDDPLTFHFHVSTLTNQEKVPNREVEPEAVLVIYSLFACILIIPYIFISVLTGFRNGDSTHAQRGWMMSWLVFNQILSVFGFGCFTNDISTPLAVTIGYSAPAIGGFVMVGRMILEFGTCSLS